jgi:hypothetical protein
MDHHRSRQPAVHQSPARHTAGGDRMMMPHPVPCCVQGCRRTLWWRAGRGSTAPPSEWICPTHWARIPRDRRRAWARLRRVARRLGFCPRPGVAHRLWSALKREASRPPFVPDEAP